ncbi:cytochrome P450 monooxygenase sdnT [Echria macrotheca]|uniref:Cytochrome P450 monooxygenase sdnT n=1 Tax=Echria macrotheca TaxID=438768 RepID=A0AAJ0BDI5_9PEZI|nr:cytochrome P450 monooxygenase sdnT [Echria macrotheca]
MDFQAFPLFILTSCFKLVGAILLVSLLTAIYRLTLHPLSAIPGPKWAAVSNIWLARHVRDGRMLALGKRLHDDFGPVVRVGPNEVWFNSRDAFRLIYNAGSGFGKSDFYVATKLNRPISDWKCWQGLNWPDTLDLLSEFDTRRYRLQRRLIGPVYQTSNVRRFERAVDEVIGRVVAKLRALDGVEVDLKEWMHIVAVECLGAVVLSWSPGYIRDGSDGGTSTQSYLGWKRKSVFGLFPLVTKLSFFSKSLGRWFSNAWGVTFATPRNFKPFFTPVYQKSSKRIAAALRQASTAKAASKDERKDLLADLVQLHRDRPEFTETYLRRLAVTNFGAGHETMCSALTSIMTMIGSHDRVRQRVNDEVRSCVPAPSPISCEDAAQLRYTQASMKEAQRLYPVIGMSLSRKVPAEGFSCHGYYIPPGYTVGCNPISLHRNRDIYGPDADEYRPERWLLELQQRDCTAAAAAAQARDMDRYHLIWGGGARTCPGRHLAEMVLCKVVPALCREFDIEVVARPGDDETKFYFMAMLTGVRARFVPV